MDTGHWSVLYSKFCFTYRPIAAESSRGGHTRRRAGADQGTVHGSRLTSASLVIAHVVLGVGSIRAVHIGGGGSVQLGLLGVAGA